MTVEGNAVPTNPRSSNSNYRYIVYSHEGHNSVNHDLGRISLRYRGLGQGSQEWGHHREGAGGGGEVLNKVLYGEASPRVPTPYPPFLLIPFLAEKVPLSYTFYRQIPVSHA